MAALSQDITEARKGCRFRVQRGGKGRPLLYLHGGSGGGEWHPFLAKLADRRLVIAPEHPGFGGAPRPSWVKTPCDWAHFYCECLEAWRIHEADVLGSSLGGWIALEMARMGAPIRALVLSAPAGVLAPGSCLPDAGSWSAREAQYRLYWDKSRVPTAPNPARVEDRDTMQFIRNSTGMRSLELEAALHSINNPTLILWGRQDEITSCENGRFLTTCMRRSKMILIDQCGHLPLQEQTKISCLAIETFLAGVDVASAATSLNFAENGEDNESLCV